MRVGASGFALPLTATAIKDGGIPPSKGANQTKPIEKEPGLVQLDPKLRANSIIPLIAERLTCDMSPFCPQGVLRTDDFRAGFFAVYRKDAAESDSDYAKKYDEDLNATLILVSDTQSG